jgi:hypothetical protein
LLVDFLYRIFHHYILGSPQSERGQGYLFLNGVKGEAPNGFQLPVTNVVPDDEDYGPIWESNYVKWNDNATARQLKSVEEILAAQSNGELTYRNINCSRQFIFTSFFVTIS